MKRTHNTLLALLIAIGFSGCSKTIPVETSARTIVNTAQGKFIIDKEKNTLHIKRTFALYKRYKSYKAMAIAMDKDGRYVIGYAKDQKSSSDAKSTALENCQKANMHAQLKVHTPCKLYAVENVIFNTLK